MRRNWLDGATIPELLRPDEDPGLRQGSYIQPAGGAEYGDFLATLPGNRPIVFQDAVNISFAATSVPGRIMPGQFPCDGIMFSVPTGETDCFWGYGSGINAASGILIPAGIPILVGPDNTRELWELQRCLEVMAGILATQAGGSPLPPYKAPRVAFDLSRYYIGSTGADQTVSVMAFRIPEGQ